MTDAVEEGALRGTLLVANPALPDPNFHHTVVLILEHGADGAVGLVLNRPGDLPVSRPLPELADLAADPALLFAGGPVERQAAICLGESAGGAGPAWQPVLGPVGVVDLSSGSIPDSIRRLRVFSGYAGWAPGQLENELAAGAWFVVPAHPDDPLTSQPERLWHDVLRRQGGGLAALGAFPDDPTVN
jgi:putative transcriptional regulator